jgi:thiamine biosynthesis lipoprotein
MDRNRLKIVFAVVVVLLTALGARFLFVPRLHTAYSDKFVVMGTFANIIAVADSQRTANWCINAAFNELSRIDSMMSSYDPDSQISQINKNAFKEPVFLGPELSEILSASIAYSEKTDGAFDVTVGPVIDLWRQAKEKEKNPTKKQIKAAQSKVGYKKLRLGQFGSTLKFDVEGMRLDLGGIAKGYAIDLAVKAMQDTGALGGMVDVGGDIRCFGSPPKSRDNWLVGLQDPAAEGGLLLVLKLNGMAVATSGDYQRFVVVEGKKHSHIMDPQTSDSAGKLTSVTIIAPKAADADALATAVSVMGTEKGLPFIESTPDTEAILISADNKNELLHTTTIRKYVDNTRPVSSYTTASYIVSQPQEFESGQPQQHQP